MNKEEILKRSRKENELIDEREKQEIGNSFGFGGIIVAILCIAFSVISAINGERFYEFGVIIFGYLAGTSWYNFKISKRKKYLVQGVACTLTIILGLIAFFLQVK